ncbi:hypothetical protein O7614_29155 [Micromonospora sp. WMMD961]|uniref:hypothetical protein n=1 Tax=Micromonospora sp. WMMD961 TaxID=3016100 RepID=UPI002415AFC0|nr:hypothetical protein [Micromonospora sp. WMMD961]MDG4783728.1 hypothetical protein [Micromonospora sp. WMMD961]
MGPTASRWWQTARTPKQGFVLGGFWLVLAVAYGVFAVGEPISWSVIVAALAALLGVGYLVTAVLLRQRLRSTQRDPR